ncbi:MAG: hypothetical protein J1E95_06695 [Muribaculaceae bacterium]|nr:hypothetical protein [Muribaculaceae bacterium]
MRTERFLRLLLIIFLPVMLTLGTACSDDPKADPDPAPNPTPNPDDNSDIVSIGPPEGKEVYIPYELRGMDLYDKNSQWYWGRTKSTQDVILFWAKGFGDDLSKAPALQGENMRVDAENLLAKVQEFYDFYYNELKFVKPGTTKADRYRMMVMLDYSLEGTAYGGTYDNEIGALWVAPNRVQDKNMNAVAHELGHSFQLQIMADNEGDGWGGSGFYEMTSQWMLWQVNPKWTDEERYHFDAFKDLTHKAFLHVENIYHSPYVIEFWGEKHGLPFIAELFRQGKIGEDPVRTYIRATGIDQERFNDEMWHNYARLVNFDIDRVRQYTRQLTKGWHTQLSDAGDGWKRIAKSNAPESYGFNIIPLTVPGAGETLKIEFKGEADAPGYVSTARQLAGWRYGLVAVDSNDKEIYGEMMKDKEGTLEFTVPEGTTVRNLWLVVMGAPTAHIREMADQWPYSIKTTNL